MAKDLIIIGAGGDGRNVAEFVRELGGEWNFLGFLDDDPEKQGSEINGFPVLGKTADVIRYGNCYFTMLIGGPGDYFLKKRLVAKLGIGLEHYATITHPSAYVSKYAKIGRGSVIEPGVTIMANAEIGNHVFIASKVNVGHDTIIGDYVSLAPLVAIAGRAVLEEGCYIGLSTSIRGQVTIGKWSLAGMGSVVVSDIPAYHVVAGNPARVLRKLEPSRFEL